MGKELGTELIYSIAALAAMMCLAACEPAPELHPKPEPMSLAEIRASASTAEPRPRAVSRPKTKPKKPKGYSLQWTALSDHEDLEQALAIWRHEGLPKLHKVKFELVDADWPSNKYSAEKLMTRFRMLRLRGENEKQEDLREYAFIDLEKRRIAPLRNEMDAMIVLGMTGGNGDIKGLKAHVDLALMPRSLCAKSAAEARWLPLPRAESPRRALAAWAERAGCEAERLNIGASYRESRRLRGIVPKSILIECLRENHECVALRRQGDAWQVLPLTGCGAFNLLREEWGENAEMGLNEFRSMAGTYMSVVHFSSMLKSLPAKYDDMPSPERWFELHPRRHFSPPSLKRDAKGFRLHYHRQDSRGMLMVGELEADTKGRILRHEERNLFRLRKAGKIRESKGLCGRGLATAWPDASWVLEPAAPVKPLISQADNADLELQWEKLPKGRLDKAIDLWFQGEKGKRVQSWHRLSPVDRDYDDPPFFKVVNWEDLKHPKYAKRSTLVVRIFQRRRPVCVTQWVVVQPKKRRVAWFRSGGELNQVLRLMKARAPRNDKEALAWALQYDKRVFNLSGTRLRRILYKLKDTRTSMSPKRWFELHPMDPFYKPRVVRGNGCWVVSFYSWRFAGTGLFRHTIIINENGQVASTLFEQLSNKVRGPARI